MLFILISQKIEKKRIHPNQMVIFIYKEKII